MTDTCADHEPSACLSACTHLAEPFGPRISNATFWGACAHPAALMVTAVPETLAPVLTSPIEARAWADPKPEVSGPNVAYASTVYAPHAPRSPETDAVERQEPSACRTPCSHATLPVEALLTANATLSGSALHRRAAVSRVSPVEVATTCTVGFASDPLLDATALVAPPTVAKASTLNAPHAPRLAGPESVASHAPSADGFAWNQRVVDPAGVTANATLEGDSANPETVRRRDTPSEATESSGSWRDTGSVSGTVAAGLLSVCPDASESTRASG